MDNSLFSQDYKVDIANNKSISPKEINVIRDKNNVAFKTQNKQEEIIFEIKFQLCQIHSLQLKNCGSPGLKITAVNTNERLFFHIVKDMNLIRNDQLFMSQYENIVYKFDFQQSDPVKSKLKYNKIILTLKNPCHNVFPRPLGIFYFIIFSQENNPLNNILSLEKPKSLQKNQNKLTAKSNKKASDLFQQRGKTLVHETINICERNISGKKRKDFNFGIDSQQKPEKKIQQNNYDEVELIVEGLDDISEQDSTNIIQSKKKNRKISFEKKDEKENEMQKAIRQSLMTHEKEKQQQSQIEKYENDLQEAIQQSMQKIKPNKITESDEEDQLQEAIRRSMVTQINKNVNLIVNDQIVSEDEFQPIPADYSNHSGKIFFTEEQKYERFSNK